MRGPSTPVDGHPRGRNPRFLDRREDPARPEGGRFLGRGLERHLPPVVGHPRGDRHRGPDGLHRGDRQRLRRSGVDGRRRVPVRGNQPDRPQRPQLQLVASGPFGAATIGGVVSSTPQFTSSTRGVFGFSNNNLDALLQQASPGTGVGTQPSQFLLSGIMDGKLYSVALQGLAQKKSTTSWPRRRSASRAPSGRRCRRPGPSSIRPTTTRRGSSRSSNRAPTTSSSPALRRRSRRSRTRSTSRRSA